MGGRSGMTPACATAWPSHLAKTRHSRMACDAEPSAKPSAVTDGAAVGGVQQPWTMSRACCSAASATIVAAVAADDWQMVCIRLSTSLRARTARQRAYGACEVKARPSNVIEWDSQFLREVLTGVPIGRVLWLCHEEPREQVLQEHALMCHC